MDPKHVYPIQAAMVFTPLAWSKILSAFCEAIFLQDNNHAHSPLIISMDTKPC
jgi:hypothetical protein